MTQTVTQLLHRWQDGDKDALNALLPLTMEELRQCAKGMLRQSGGKTAFQPTELIHEAYLRLVDLKHMSWENRIQFFGLAANMMRNILVDKARKVFAQKRGAGAMAITFGDDCLSSKSNPEDLLALDQALLELQELDERKANVVALRYFGGLNGAEIAHFLNVDERTVKRDWQFSKVWLFQKLKPGS